MNQFHYYSLKGHGGSLSLPHIHLLQSVMEVFSTTSIHVIAARPMDYMYVKTKFVIFQAFSCEATAQFEQTKITT